MSYKKTCNPKFETQYAYVNSKYIHIDDYKKEFQILLNA